MVCYIFVFRPLLLRQLKLNELHRVLAVDFIDIHASLPIFFYILLWNLFSHNVDWQWIYAFVDHITYIMRLLLILTCSGQGAKSKSATVIFSAIFQNIREQCLFYCYFIFRIFNNNATHYYSSIYILYYLLIIVFINVPFLFYIYNWW